MKINLKNLKDKDFPKKTIELKEKIKKGQSLNEILPEAFALVREASREQEMRDIMMFK